MPRPISQYRKVNIDGKGAVWVVGSGVYGVSLCVCVCVYVGGLLKTMYLLFII